MKRNLIESEYRDTDGYWIYLKHGFVLSGERTHSIVENTKRAAYAQLANVVPCSCAECQMNTKPAA